MTDQSKYKRNVSDYMVHLPFCRCNNEGGDCNCGLPEAVKKTFQFDNAEILAEGLSEGSELWKKEYDDCRELLTELVMLKHLKDTEGKTREYLQRQPKAWEAANKFLNSYQHQ